MMTTSWHVFLTNVGWRLWNRDSVEGSLVQATLLSLETSNMGHFLYHTLHTRVPWMMLYKRWYFVSGVSSESKRSHTKVCVNCRIIHDLRQGNQSGPYAPAFTKGRQQYWGVHYRISLDQHYTLAGVSPPDSFQPFQRTDTFLTLKWSYWNCTCDFGSDSRWHSLSAFA